jgi:hypothetical protein
MIPNTETKDTLTEVTLGQLKAGSLKGYEGNFTWLGLT